MGARGVEILLVAIFLLMALNNFFVRQDIAHGVETGILKAIEQLDCKGAQIEITHSRSRESR